MGETSPFVVGQKVVFADPSIASGVRQDEVARVHKTGRFVLVGLPKQQWRARRARQRPAGAPLGSGPLAWEAWPTGYRSCLGVCRPWDEQLVAKQDVRAEKSPSTPTHPLPFTGEAGG